VFYDARAVGAVRELKIEKLCVIFRLLQSVSGQCMLGLCLDDRERAIRCVGQQVVQPLWLAATDLSAGDDDPAWREGELLS